MPLPGPRRPSKAGTNYDHREAVGLCHRGAGPTGQVLGVGAQLLTIAPLDEYQVRVPIYKLRRVQAAQGGVDGLRQNRETEYKGTIERLGP